MKKSAILRLVVLLGAGAAIGLGLVFLPVKQYLKDFVEWVQGLGPWGPVVLGAAYIPACLFFIPGSLITLGAGFSFGIFVGTVAVSVGSILGASAAFWVGRTLARGWIEKKVSNHPKFRAIDQAVGEQGFKIVLLTRLSPVFPFTLLNYAFGLTRVSFRDYFLASWIGMLPGTILYVYLGTTIMNLTEAAAGTTEKSTAQQVFFYLGLVVTVVVTIFVTRLAKKALDKAIPAAAKEQAAAAQGVHHG
jgi:uncharacterized membrane protein YdjX (TVP38/TMEM64 family)